MKLLIINPGSTSTKLALYDGAKKLLQENLEHDAAALQQYHGIGDQVPMRLAVIRDFLDRSGVHPEELAAVIGRGGLVFGLKTGGYLVNEDLAMPLWTTTSASRTPRTLAACWPARSLRRSASPPISTTL